MMGYAGSERMSDRILSPVVRQHIEEIMMRENKGFLSLIEEDFIVQVMNELGPSEAVQVLDTYVDTIENHLISGGILEPLQANTYLMRLVHTARETMLSPPTMGRNSGLSYELPSLSPTYSNLIISGEDDMNSYCFARARTRVTERVTPMIQQMLEEIFSTEEDSRVLEDRSLMQMLSRIPELHAAQALRKYQQTVQQRGRASINNPCGYLISLLKKAQEGSREDSALSQLSQSRNLAKPLRTLNPRVRAELEKTFENRSDRSVLEDVGLIKQLGRLDENQAIEAIANYREASNRRNGKSILNPSAYFMVILREYIEGTTPLHPGCSDTNTPTLSPIDTNDYSYNPHGGRIGAPGYSTDSVLSLSPTVESRFSGTSSRGVLGINVPQFGDDNNSLIGPRTGFQLTPTSVSKPLSYPSPAPFFTTTPTFKSEGQSLSPTFPMRSPIKGGDESLGYFTPTNACNAEKTPKASEFVPPPTSPVFTIYSNPLHSPGFRTSPGRYDSREEFPIENSGPHPQSPINMMREIHRQQRLLAHAQAQQELAQLDDTPPQSPIHKISGIARSPIYNSMSKSPVYSSSNVISKSPVSVCSTISASALAKVNLENSNKAFLKSQDEVSELLSKLGLYKYAENMREAEVDMEALRLFEENDLKELGLPKGPRIKILHTLHGDTIESGCGSSIASPKLSIASPNSPKLTHSPKLEVSPRLTLTPKRGLSPKMRVSPKPGSLPKLGISTKLAYSKPAISTEFAAKLDPSFEQVFES